MRKDPENKNLDKKPEEFSWKGLLTECWKSARYSFDVIYYYEIRIAIFVSIFLIITLIINEVFFK